jgi:hypothetical protein
MRLLLVGVLLVGLCAACGGAQADEQAGDAYREFIPACEVLPGDTVAAVTGNRPAVAAPVTVEPDTDNSSECRREFEDPKFSVWVSLHVIRFQAEDGKTGVERARYWLLSYGADIGAAPAVGTNLTPPPSPSARGAEDLGFEAVSLGEFWGSATLYGVDRNAAVVVEYGHAPNTQATRDDIPADEDWTTREATFQLARDISVRLHRYRAE